MGTSSFCDNQEEEGIIPRIINELFSEINNRKKEKDFIIKVSFLEIYNEEIHDLLDNTIIKRLFIILNIFFSF